MHVPPVSKPKHLCKVSYVVDNIDSRASMICCRHALRGRCVVCSASASCCSRIPGSRGIFLGPTTCSWRCSSILQHGVHFTTTEKPADDGPEVFHFQLHARQPFAGSAWRTAHHIMPRPQSTSTCEDFSVWKASAVSAPSACHAVGLSILPSTHLSVLWLVVVTGSYTVHLASSETCSLGILAVTACRGNMGHIEMAGSS